MKYLLLGLAIAAALLGGVVFSGGEAYAGDEIRLRAFLSTPLDDPFGLSVADFRERPDRTRFSTEVHNVAQDVEVAHGTVRVTSSVSGVNSFPITIVLDPIRGTGAGHLELDSRLGDDVPPMVPGDTVEVFLDGVAEPIRTGTLNPK